MLDVLLGEGIHNTAVVVTRYFGGTLLGTGGLVRAYAKSVQAGLAASTVLEKKKAFCCLMETDYSGIGKIQYLLGQRRASDHRFSVYGQSDRRDAGSAGRACLCQRRDHRRDERQDGLCKRRTGCLCI